MIRTKPYPSVTLEFDENRHQFFVNGDPVSSVTSFTKIIDKSAPLMAWQERLTREALLEHLASGREFTAEAIREIAGLHRTRKQEAASLGTLVHDWAENFAKGIKQPMPEDPKLLNGVTAFLRWVDDTGFKFTKAEHYVYSKKYGYAGIIDAWGKTRRKLATVDYKTGSGVYPEMRFQAAGYQQALQEMLRKKIDERWIVRFDKETGEFHPTLCEDFKADFEAFRACIAISERLGALK
jgi:ATP-dependent exoDNAse (exonuclease V) beta subunit